MFYRLKRALQYTQFNAAIRSVLQTAPLPIVESNLRIVSMLCERDVLMYLLAAKTFYGRIGHGRFIVIPDWPMPESTKETLLHHLGGAVGFVPLATIDTGRCQRGGCWERLLTCLDYTGQHYVIQLDSDTLTIGDIPEVRDAVAANRAFTLAARVTLQSFEEAAASRRAPRPDDHVIDVAQRAFARHPRRSALNYVRGSAAFAGFPMGGADRAAAEQFHAEMEELVGARWREWGSEQVASNVIIANAPDPLVLPWPDYASIGPETPFERVRFGHFLGSDRFTGQRFARSGAALIAAMRAR
jgi:hypothetical protein